VSERDLLEELDEETPEHQEYSGYLDEPGFPDKPRTFEDWSKS